MTEQEVRSAWRYRSGSMLLSSMVFIACIWAIWAVFTTDTSGDKAATESGDVPQELAHDVVMVATLAGVKVYRFTDGDQPVYFTVPPQDMEFVQRQACADGCQPVPMLKNHALQRAL